MEFPERFERLDPAVWTDGYLPAWSSRTAASATGTVGAGGLVLSIPPEQPLWCADEHPTPLRVSGIHSANRSGPVGSTDAPQPFRPGLPVREEQPAMMGFVPRFGTISVTCSAVLTPGSMFSAWMVGLEDQPERSGEICLMEVFGNTIVGGWVEVGQGIHPFRDPLLRDDFSTRRHRLDVSQPHAYRVDWLPDRVAYSIDGVAAKVSEQAPGYPMMLILGLFDFPGRGVWPTVPELRVSEVSGTNLGAGSILGR